MLCSQALSSWSAAYSYIDCDRSKETYYSVKRDLLQCQKRPDAAYSYGCSGVVREAERERKGLKRGRGRERARERAREGESERESEREGERGRGREGEREKESLLGAANAL